MKWIFSWRTLCVFVGFWNTCISTHFSIWQWWIGKKLMNYWRWLIIFKYKPCYTTLRPLSFIIFHRFGRCFQSANINIRFLGYSYCLGTKSKRNKQKKLKIFFIGLYEENVVLWYIARGYSLRNMERKVVISMYNLLLENGSDKTSIFTLYTKIIILSKTL